MRINGSVLIGRNGDEYIFVNSVFDHGGGLRGAAGCSVRPVSTDEYDWATQRENVEERLIDHYEAIYDGKLHSDESRETDFQRFVDDVIQYDGIDNIMWDESYCCEASEAFDELGIEHECTDCIGWGRVFDKNSDYEEIYNLAAWVAIRSLEAGSFTAEHAAKIIFGDKNND